MSSPCHIELILTEKGSDVKNEVVSCSLLHLPSVATNFLLQHSRRTVHKEPVCTRFLCALSSNVAAAVIAQESGQQLCSQHLYIIAGAKGAQAFQGAAVQQAEELKQIKELMSCSST